MNPGNRILSRLLLATVLLTIAASVLLPNTRIAWMREHWVWFNIPMLWIERMESVVNLVHAILFVLLGMATRLALPHWRARRVAAALLLLGIVTEVVQVLVPGRHPRLSDVLVDLVAGVLGWMAIHALTRWRTGAASGEHGG